MHLPERQQLHPEVGRDVGGLTDEETSTTTALNLVHFQSCPSSLSGDMVRTQPSRSLSIQRRPAPAKASGLF